jgi:hypothetical protein
VGPTQPPLLFLPPLPLSPHSSVFSSQSHHGIAPPSLSRLAPFLSPREASPSSSSSAPIAFGLYRGGIRLERGAPSEFEPAKTPPSFSTLPPRASRRHRRRRLGSNAARSAGVTPSAAGTFSPPSSGPGRLGALGAGSLRWFRWVLACGLDGARGSGFRARLGFPFFFLFNFLAPQSVRMVG